MNLLIDVCDLKFSGKLFQIDGPQKENALSPYVFKKTRGVESSLELLDLRVLDGTYGTQSSWMCNGEFSL